MFGMEIGIIGIPKSGKTTIFNALTKGNAETAAYAPSGLQPNIGVAKVEDSRIRTLSEMYKPEKTTPAEVKYIDIAVAPGDTSKKGSFSGQFLTYLGRVDAIIHVVRAFDDENVPHPEIKIDPERDINTINLELAFSDLVTIERRLKRIEESFKSANQQEREKNAKEQALLLKIKEELENEHPIRELQLTDEEKQLIRNYSFLTIKPLLILLNIGENQLKQADTLEKDLLARHSGQYSNTAVLCGKLEMELTQLNNEEAAEFRKDLNITEAALDRVIRLSYALLGQISFFTSGEDEVKAWTISNNTTASKAAGKIHSDIERGFIRAEVISFQDLIDSGNMTVAKKKGLLRLEGKDYIVKDGDIINFLFNV